MCSDYWRGPGICLTRFSSRQCKFLEGRSPLFTITSTYHGVHLLPYLPCLHRDDRTVAVRLSLGKLETLLITFYITDILQGELNAPAKVIKCEVEKIVTISSIGLPQCIPMAPSTWGVVQSIFTIGGLVGALAIGPASSKYGRLPCMRATTPLFVLGGFAEALAPNIPILSLGRFLSGIGAGASTVVCPIYISEISPLEKRGLFGAFTQVMINCGILIAQSLGYFLSKGQLWRIILAVAGVIGALELLGLMFAPESPKWLAENKRTHQARLVLQRIRGADADINEEIKEWGKGTDEEQQGLLSASPAYQKSEQAAVSFTDVITIPKYRVAVIGVMAVCCVLKSCCRK